MPTPKSCCNPLQKENHKRVRTNLFLISAKYGVTFTPLIGKYICASCKSKMYITSHPVRVEDENASDSESTDEDDISRDSSFIPQHEIEKEKMIAIVQAITESSNKRLKLDISGDERKNLIQMSDKIQLQLRNGIPANKDQNEKWVEELKEAISKKPSKSERVFLLTTIPVEWSVRKTAKVFGVSRRSASRAKKLRLIEGYASRVNPKTGHPLDESILEQVKNFYLSDEISRVLPGKKDSKSVVIDGKRQHVTVSCSILKIFMFPDYSNTISKSLQKRLLLGNLDELHSRFLKDFPEVRISLAKFRSLRPPQCILVGAKGTHNVCVCKTHQNVRLKIQALKQEFLKNKIDFQETYHDWLEKIVCKNPQSECYLLECKKCPGTNLITREIKSIFIKHDIKKIEFHQWTSTDR